ncbi:Cell division and transport-associated protein TolR [Amphritea atlantica]|jgi:biopolymer transport protein TolR|uniref:Tol-Pal system protein TolR n=1 Tax=Amphritea atlantica TaxID=355243 RepID=A0A1H9FRD1_9GAMM|nr:protein TolR [Amphritea atlantica]SEQ40457.1 Cell division and transport-associated protein TolR [Amphritea atlantica]
MIRRVKKRRKLNAEINVVPYIDVMMVLLVIFMITAPMLTQGVDVQLPKAGSDPVDTEDSEPLIVTVDKEGLYYIDVGGDPLKAVTGDVVEERVSKVLSNNPKKLLLVRGDKGVDYDHVIQLMTLLQQAGAETVGLVTE